MEQLNLFALIESEKPSRELSKDEAKKQVQEYLQVKKVDVDSSTTEKSTPKKQAPVKKSKPELPERYLEFNKIAPKLKGEQLISYLEKWFDGKISVIKNGYMPYDGVVSSEMYVLPKPIENYGFQIEFAGCDIVAEQYILYIYNNQCYYATFSMEVDKRLIGEHRDINRNHCAATLAQIKKVKMSAFRPCNKILSKYHLMGDSEFDFEKDFPYLTEEMLREINVPWEWWYMAPQMEQLYKAGYDFVKSLNKNNIEEFNRLTQKGNSLKEIFKTEPYVFKMMRHQTSLSVWDRFRKMAKRQGMTKQTLESIYEAGYADREVEYVYQLLGRTYNEKPIFKTFDQLLR